MPCTEWGSGLYSQGWECSSSLAHAGAKLEGRLWPFFWEEAPR